MNNPDRSQIYLFAGDLAEYFSALSKLERRGFNSELIEDLIRRGVADKNFLQNQQSMAELREFLTHKGYEVGELSWNEERGIYEMMVKMPLQFQKADQAVFRDIRPVKIGRGLIYSADYQHCLVLGNKILQSDYPPFEVLSKENENGSVIIDDKRKLLTLLMEEGKKGLVVQRYKGLGEMNPEQLWNTTMDPQKRNLLQVKVEDVVETDEIFTILMGDEVEPRREFIQNNALEVGTLDI
jgi:DNA gyrase subunit B